MPNLTERRSSHKPFTMGGLLMVKNRMTRWRTRRQGGKIAEEIKVKYENTYRMEPNNNLKFDVKRVEKAADASLQFHLSQTRTYNRDKCASTSSLIADDIKKRVKAMNFPRYKIIVHVTIGQCFDQDMTVASRGLMDLNQDSCAKADFKQGDVYALALIYGLYNE